LTTDFIPRTEANSVGRKGIEDDAELVSSLATLEGTGVLVGLGDDGVVGHGVGEMLATISEAGSGEGDGKG
jgi:hypothetical protein